MYTIVNRIECFTQFDELLMNFILNNNVGEK